MASLPVGLIKGYRNVRMEKMDIVGRKNETRARVDAIRNKVGGTQCTLNDQTLIVGRKNETRTRVDAIRNKVGGTQHTCLAA